MAGKIRGRVSVPSNRAIETTQFFLTDDFQLSMSF